MAVDLRSSQLALARYLRDPVGSAPPEGVEVRRLKVYQDLIYNNIEGFISGGFPVLRSLYGEDDWHGLVRRFIDQHRCHTPYFLEISQEFLQFLLKDCPQRDCDPPFVAELAHYEWVELALDVSEEESPAALPVEDLLQAVPRLSPLAWSLRYRYPVHRIGPGFRPQVPGDPTYLVVYRNREDRVRFVELNAATARLLELVRENEFATAHALIAVLAAEMGKDAEAIVGFARSQLEEFAACSVVLLDNAAGTAP